MIDSIERVLTESNKRDVEGHPSKNDDREAIWAIRPRWSTPYFVLFTLQVVVGFGIATYDGVSSTTHDKWIQAYFDIILRTGQIGIAAAIITFTVIELLSSTMLMSEWIRVNLVEPAKERNRVRIGKTPRGRPRRIPRPGNLRDEGLGSAPTSRRTARRNLRRAATVLGERLL